MPVCLITGASGFLGRHLEAISRSNRPDVEALVASRTTSVPNPWPFGVVPADRPRRPRPGLTRLDRRGPPPRRVFHLAGKTPPGTRRRVLSAQHARDGPLSSMRSGRRIALVGSCWSVRRRNWDRSPVESLPVGEDHPCRPADPYGLSKWLATCAGLAAGVPLEVVIGPGLQPDRPGACPPRRPSGSFADELADWASGPIQPLPSATSKLPSRLRRREGRRPGLGSPSVRGGQPGQIYHVGTGRSHRVGRGTRSADRPERSRGRVEVDPARLRSRGPADSRADVRRIATEAGWSAEVTWERSLRGPLGRCRGSVEGGIDRTARTLRIMPSLGPRIGPSLTISRGLTREGRHVQSPVVVRGPRPVGDLAHRRDGEDTAPGAGWPQVPPGRPPVPGPALGRCRPLVRPAPALLGPHRGDRASWSRW